MGADFLLYTCPDYGTFTEPATLTAAAMTRPLQVDGWGGIDEVIDFYSWAHPSDDFDPETDTSDEALERAGRLILCEAIRMVFDGGGTAKHGRDWGVVSWHGCMISGGLSWGDAPTEGAPWLDLIERFSPTLTEQVGDPVEHWIEGWQS